MTDDSFRQRLSRQLAFPEPIFVSLCEPLLAAYRVQCDPSAAQAVFERAILRTLRLRDTLVIPRGLAPEDAVREHDMWSYTTLVIAMRAQLGYVENDAIAKHWVLTMLPVSAREWLRPSIIDSLRIHAQGRTSSQAPLLSLVLRAFAHESVALAMRPAIDSLYARAEADEIKHDRFGADLYFPDGSAVMTRGRFDALTFGAFRHTGDAELIVLMNRSGIDAEHVTFSISNAPDRLITGICIYRQAALPPYSDLVRHDAAAADV